MSTTTNMLFHDHPISCITKRVLTCPLCYKKASESGIIYHCTVCDFYLHKECVEEWFLNKPFHYDHFLKIFKYSSPDNENHHCYICRYSLTSLFAQCTICNINMDLSCMRNSLPSSIFQPKHHKHSFSLLLRNVTFTCNACGLEGYHNPYLCLECNLMLHKDCIDLPRVISINRHDHYISHTFRLGKGVWESCGVCRKKIDGDYGGFTCSRCPTYAVHSKCATRKEVWDGIELEDVPQEEKEEETEDPFKVINEKDIIHFSHENHIMRLDENYVLDHHHHNMRCGGCILPINTEPYYKCLECDFILHVACASLPRKKRHFLHNHKLTLRPNTDKASIFWCEACGSISNGFRYECYHETHCDIIQYDVRCSSLLEPFHHDLHQHPLYWTLEGSKVCQLCLSKIGAPLCCTICDYALCVKCAILPRKVKHRCDDHFLSLSQGAGNSDGDLWCDICERKTDPNVRYYTCEECGVSLHINCVLGDLYYMKVGYMAGGVELLANNGVTRPYCCICEDRCMFPFLLRETKEDCTLYICSLHCLSVASNHL